MITLLLLIFSIILLIASAFIAIRLISFARKKLSWILFSVAFMLFALVLVIDLFLGYDIVGENALHLKHILIFFIAVLLFVGVISIGKMLRKLKRAENKRYLSEQRFKALFNNSTDEMFVTDFEGNIVEANKAASGRLGFVKTELATMNIRDVCSSAYLMQLNKTIENVKKEGSLSMESEQVTKNNNLVPVEIKCKLVSIAGHDFILWIAHDISGRKEIEKRILGAIIDTEERERERFAKDLHDGLGPLLSTIKLYANELDSTSITKSDRNKYIQQMNEMIDDAINSARSISNNLTPHVISKYGLVKAVNAFIKKINTIHKIKISFKAVDADRKYDRTIELVFFRVITELINNTIKHANATEIHIVLEVINEKLILSFRDNGCGFDPEEAIKRSPEGIGLKNIKSRIESVNGYINFYNHEGNGTNIKIKVNLS
jgi:PAS domain S-box-containing protein